MVNYSDYQLEKTSRTRENIEWSITYTYNSRDTSAPRVLLIGDSICNGYQRAVRESLADKANVTFWASSKCVTDPDYFRELDFIVGAYHYDMVSFNNGLHSLSTDPEEWMTAFDAALRFLKEKLPDSKLVVTLSTPLCDKTRNEKVIAINERTAKIAGENELPILDLYTPMAALDLTEAQSDGCHFRQPAIEMQSKIIAAYVTERLGLSDIGLKQESTATGPSGALK